ncbi:carbohydrate ABC transporter permease [Nocardioides bruguierae]|uniref:carbohydrate ABC transporter permease n=1 Tax=Nocardioides bruguierae TaxID=2945102 RepID=UPI002020146C|nr:carbohydrate ABC transporter permease [Nocardioides bruguierae]MCL8026919.1 carbohydrate ABC transporter permease [Nocardioides bruguierae]
MAMQALPESTGTTRSSAPRRLGRPGRTGGPTKAAAARPRGRGFWKTVLGLVLTGLMLFPLYWMVNVSLTERSAIREASFYPRAFTLDNYRTVLGDQLPYLGTSVIIGLGTVVLTLIISAPAGYALGKLLTRGKRALSFLLIVAQMIPAVVMALGFYAVYTDLGVLDTLPGLILADSTIAVPFAVMLFSAFMSGIPKELLEAAQIDGASHTRTFFTVVLPLSRNAAVTVGLFAFLWAWSDFLFTSTLNRGGGDLRPITMGLYDYIGSQNQEWGQLMATAVLASIPTAVLLVVAQRFVAAGLTAGAVKD